MASKWKRLYKQRQKENDTLYAGYKEKSDEIERLNGILEKMLPTGAVGARIVALTDEIDAKDERITQLKTTNEFLEGKTKHQEARIKELDEQITDWKKVADRDEQELQVKQNRINELDSALAVEVAKAMELHQAHATKVQKIKDLESWTKVLQAQIDNQTAHLKAV